jgi:hypothetical protein
MWVKELEGVGAAQPVAVKEPEQVLPITCSRQCLRETARGVNSPA